MKALRHLFLISTIGLCQFAFAGDVDQYQPINSISTRGTSDVMELITSRSSHIIDGLPSIKKVYPTGEKPLLVINLKCPAEVLVGESFAIPNVMRSALNMVFLGIADTNLLSFNIQVVCS
jgi:hypothetical protein